jgi:methyl-accepting chemotaxis protein
MSMSPISQARRADRMFSTAVATVAIGGLAAAWSAGVAPAWLGAVTTAVGLLIAGAWRWSGTVGSRWALAVSLMAGVLVVSALMPHQPALLLLAPAVLSLLPQYRSPMLIAVVGLGAAAAPWWPGATWAVEHRLVMSSVLVAQTAIMIEYARISRRFLQRLFDVDFMMRAMQSGDSIRLDLGVVKPETRFGERLKQIQERMASALQRVAGSAHAAGQAAVQLQASSGDLTDRTQVACNELAGAAGTLQQIAVIVKASADAAMAARQSAQGASVLAQDGATIVHDMVGQMAAIDAASRRIGEITTLIESIAFQTNLLALNAAVEAARAGDQGRSFAVVAAEVRSLAQRVARAAGEVATLVNESNQAISRGNVLAKTAGRTMDDLTAAVARVDTVFHDLSADTNEHAAGIEAMSASLLELNAATQRNLDVANQARDIASDLTNHADGLAEAMGSFRLAGGQALTWQPAPRAASAAPGLGSVTTQPTSAGSGSATAAAAPAGKAESSNVEFF